MENIDVLEDLVAHETIKDAGFKAVLNEGPDGRGIDVGLIYRPSEFKVLETESIPYTFNDSSIDFEMSKKDRKKMAVIRSAEKRSREAVTHWSVVERFGRFTLVRCQLETGRTHQIRVHMASIGHALLGDGVYGGDGTQFEARHRKLIDGQCLFAAELSFTHPTTAERMTLSAPLPEYFEKLIEELRKENL